MRLFNSEDIAALKALAAELERVNGSTLHQDAEYTLDLCRRWHDVAACMTVVLAKDAADATGADAETSYFQAVQSDAIDDLTGPVSDALSTHWDDRPSESWGMDIARDLQGRVGVGERKAA